LIGDEFPRGKWQALASSPVALVGSLRHYRPHAVNEIRAVSRPFSEE
jgi:hypothetical protein